MTLRGKIFLPLALLSGLLFLFLYGYWFPKSLHNLEQEELHATAQHLSSVAEGLVPLLLAHQLDTLYANLDSLHSQNRDWVAIRLVDADGRLLYPLQEATPTAPDNNLRTLEHRIQFLGNDLGKLSLTINLSSAVTPMQTRYRQLVTALLMVLCGYLLSIGYVVERVVRRPVNRLAYAAAKIAQGDFELPLVKTGNDEVGTLVDSFAAMRNAIRDYQETLLLRNRAIGRLSQAVEQSPVSIMIADLEGRITFVNPEFSRITGYTPEEVLGQNPRILKSGMTSADEYAALWRSISAGGTWSGEFCNKRKSGELYWESASIAPIWDENGTITAYLALKEDISERKLAEDTLRKTAARLSEAQRIAQMGNWELDLTCWRFSWSDEVYRICEVDPAAFEASYEAFLQLVHPDDRETVDAAYQTAVRTRTFYSIDHRLLLAGGKVKYVHEQGETCYERETPVRFVGTVQDITEQKLVEERLRTLSVELEQRVSERTAELQEKYAELERLNRLFVGRELRMVELKEQIKALEQRATGVNYSNDA